MAGPLLCGAVVAVSIPLNAFITGGDATTPELAPGLAIHHLATAWNDAAGFGRDNALSRPLLFPILFVDWLLGAANASPLIINHIWVIVIAMCQSFFTLRLFRAIFPGRDTLPALLFVSLACVLNPFFLIDMHSPYPTTQLSIAFFPGVLAAAIRHSRNPTGSTLFEFAVMTALSAAGDVNYGLAAVETAVVTCVVVLIAAKQHANKNRYAIPAQLALTFVGVNVVWWAPAAHYILATMPRLVAEMTPYSDDTLRVTSQYSGLPNSVRLVGSYLFFNNAGSRPFLPEGGGYAHNVWLIIASSALPLLAAWSLRYRERNGYSVFVVLVGTLIALFLAKGTAAPAGFAFQWLYDHIHLFQAFRQSFDKFEWVVALGYSLLAGVALNGIWSEFRVLPRATVVVVSFALLLVAAYPIILGHLFWEPIKVRIPQRYFAMATWLNGEPDYGKVIDLPVAPSVFDAYSWGYVGSGLNENIVALPIIAREYDFGVAGNRALDDVMQRYSALLGNDQVASLLGLYGIRYVVNDPTINPRFFGDFSSDLMPRPGYGFESAHQFGSITVYKARSNLVNDFAYAANQTVSGPRNVAEEAIACRVLESCKSVAFVYSNIPSGARMIGDVITIADSSQNSPSRTGEIWMRETMTSPASVAEVGSRRGDIVDFGNTTVFPKLTTRPSLPPVIYGGLPPVVTALVRASPRRDDFLALPIVDELHEERGSTIKLCSEKNGEVSRVLAVNDPRLTGHIGIVAAAYAGNTMESTITASTGALSSMKFSVQDLDSSARPQAFARLIRLAPKSGPLNLTFTVRGYPRRGCVTFSSIRVGVAADDEHWSLLGGANSLQATPLYFARSADPLSRYADSLERVSSYNHQTPYRPKAMYANWRGAAAAVAGMTGPRWHVDSSVEARHSSDVTRISVRSGVASTHATFAHLLPGAAFEVTVPTDVVEGGSASFIIFSDTGTALGKTVLGPLAGWQRASLKFTLPKDASAAIVYLYVDGKSSGHAFVQVGSPAITLTSGKRQIVTFVRGRNLLTPAALSAIQVDDSEWKINVFGAPPRWLLVAANSYDDDWRLDTPTSVRTHHIKVNLFENGWLVDGAGSYVLRLRYQAVAYLWWGLMGGIGLVMLAVAMQMLVIPHQRDRFPKTDVTRRTSV